MIKYATEIVDLSVCDLYFLYLKLYLDLLESERRLNMQTR